MFIDTKYTVTEYTRTSRLGKIHTYKRRRTLLVFRCDNCGSIFERNKGAMDPKRVNNNVYHVCSNCNAKQFAQSKGVESRHIWDMPISSLKKIGNL